MTATHLNLKWTVADTDAIISMARSGFTAGDICQFFMGARLESEPGEIKRICDDAGVFIRLQERTVAK